MNLKKIIFLEGNIELQLTTSSGKFYKALSIMLFALKIAHSSTD